MIYLLAILVFILFFIGTILYHRWKIIRKRREMAHKAALDIINSMKKTYPETHERVCVDAGDFPDRDLKFYEEQEQRFESLGFNYVGDIEDRTLSLKNPATRTFIRCLIAVDGCSYLSIYDATPLESAKNLKGIEIESELESGSFILTTLAPENFMSYPPELIIRRLAADTPAASLIQQHEAYVQDYCLKSHTKPIRFETINDLLACQARQITIKHRYRKALGFGLTELEKQAFAQGHRPELMQAIFAELDRLASQEKS